MPRLPVRYRHTVYTWRVLQGGMQCAHIQTPPSAVRTAYTTCRILRGRVCDCVGGGGGYIPPCKIHTGYTWRISQGGVCAIRRIRSYRPSPASRGGEQLHSAGMYRGCLHWGVPQAAAARLWWEGGSLEGVNTHPFLWSAHCGVYAPAHSSLRDTPYTTQCLSYSPCLDHPDK